MSNKPNIRSFRFSDEVAAILQGSPGKNMNDKFENLVLHCYYEYPRAQERLEKARAELVELLRQMQDMKDLANNLQGLERRSSAAVESVQWIAQELSKTARKISGM